MPRLSIQERRANRRLAHRRARSRRMPSPTVTPNSWIAQEGILRGIVGPSLSSCVKALLFLAFAGHQLDPACTTTRPSEAGLNAMQPHGQPVHRLRCNVRARLVAHPARGAGLHRQSQRLARHPARAIGGINTVALRALSSAALTVVRSYGIAYRLSGGLVAAAAVVAGREPVAPVPLERQGHLRHEHHRFPAGGRAVVRHPVLAPPGRATGARRILRGPGCLRQGCCSFGPSSRCCRRGRAPGRAPARPSARYLPPAGPGPGCSGLRSPPGP